MLFGQYRNLFRRNILDGTQPKIFPVLDWTEVLLVSKHRVLWDMGKRKYKEADHKEYNLTSEWRWLSSVLCEPNLTYSSDNIVVSWCLGVMTAALKERGYPARTWSCLLWRLNIYVDDAGLFRKQRGQEPQIFAMSRVFPNIWGAGKGSDKTQLTLTVCWFFQVVSFWLFLSNSFYVFFVIFTVLSDACGTINISKYHT